MQYNDMYSTLMLLNLYTESRAVAARDTHMYTALLTKHISVLFPHHLTQQRWLLAAGKQPAPVHTVSDKQQQPFVHDGKSLYLFGAGPRVCPGQQLALTNIKVCCLECLCVAKTLCVTCCTQLLRTRWTPCTSVGSVPNGAFTTHVQYRGARTMLTQFSVKLQR
jgi:hypothetical protein